MKKMVDVVKGQGFRRPDFFTCPQCGAMVRNKTVVFKMVRCPACKKVFSVAELRW